MSEYKIAVYTIALNEEKHVKRWFDSAIEADLLVIADTGSTDKTRFIAKSLGISVTQIKVNPWRFDVARNASLALIPEDFDICIQLDMDEVLPEGWRKKVEDAYDSGNLWPTYKEVSARNSDGTIKASWDHFRIHSRQGFKWKYPIHEVLVPTDGTMHLRERIDLEIDHLKDHSKSRHSYLALLEQAVQEEPHDWRMNHYLNREYFYIRDWIRVLQSAYKCESLAGGWDVERASTYMWASEAAHHLALPPLAEEWAKKATEAADHFYEAWHWRAHIAHLNSKWTECLEFANKRMTLERQSHHLVKPDVWDWWGYDLVALASANLKKVEDAVIYGDLAVRGAPNNDRLKRNLRFYMEERDNPDHIDGNPVEQLEGLDFFFKYFPLSESIQVMDVGAAAIAETPNYKKLVNSGVANLHVFEGDRRQIDSIRESFGPKVSIYQDFLFDGKPASLFVASPASGMTSLLKPCLEALSFFNGFQDFGQVHKVKTVDTSRLDDLKNLPQLDFIKMDIQGAELNVLKNGIDQVQNCLAIQLEVSWMHLYENQPSFGEVDVWMRSQGFVPHSFINLKRWSITPTIFDGNFRIPGNQLLESDILYIKNPFNYIYFTDSQLVKLIWLSHYIFQSFDLCVYVMLELVARGKLDPLIQLEYSTAIAKVVTQ
jgi:FkbM family methyltransferase